MDRRQRPVAVLGGVVLIGVMVAGPLWAGPILAPHGSAAPLAVSGGSATLQPHANLETTAPPPTGSTPPGETVGAVYAVESPTYPRGSGPATVRIPAAIVGLAASTGTLHLHLAALNLTLVGPNQTTGAAGPYVRFPAALQFNGTPAATLTTQGVAVMAAWPRGAYPVEFRWQWVLEAPDGSVASGPWSSWSTVTPAQLVDLSVASSAGWTTGSPQPLCVSGTLAGRSFSAHISVASPPQVFDTGTVTVPSGQSGPYCWPNTVPAGTPPQQAFVHLWEYSNLTFLLDVVVVQLVAPTVAAPGHASTSGPGLTGLVLTGIEAAGLLALIVVEVLYVLAPSTLRKLLPSRLRGAEPGSESVSARNPTGGTGGAGRG